MKPNIEDEPNVVSLDDIGDSGELRLPRNAGPDLSAGDIDARWDQAESGGEETAGGSVPTPDQDIVEEIGRAIGVTYQEGEPLRVGEKEHERDAHRWELDPASAEDYRERLREEITESEPILTMRHNDQYKDA
jgi:hypothetical protein